MLDKPSKIWYNNSKEARELVIKLWTPQKDYASRYYTRKKIMGDPRKRLWESTKRSAVTRNLEHSISLNDIVIPEFCPILGIKLSASGQANNSPSVDRVNSTIGYVPGNVRVISMRANRLKDDGTIEEFEKIIQYMRND